MNKAMAKRTPLAASGGTAAVAALAEVSFSGDGAVTPVVKADAKSLDRTELRERSGAETSEPAGMKQAGNGEGGASSFSHNRRRHTGRQNRGRVGGTSPELSTVKTKVEGILKEMVAIGKELETLAAQVAASKERPSFRAIRTIQGKMEQLSTQFSSKCKEYHEAARPALQSGNRQSLKEERELFDIAKNLFYDKYLKPLRRTLKNCEVSLKAESAAQLQQGADAWARERVTQKLEDVRDQLQLLEGAAYDLQQPLLAHLKRLVRNLNQSCSQLTRETEDKLRKERDAGKCRMFEARLKGLQKVKKIGASLEVKGKSMVARRTAPAVEA